MSGAWVQLLGSAEPTAAQQAQRPAGTQASSRAAQPGLWNANGSLGVGK